MGVVVQHPNWLEQQLSQRLWLMQQAGTLCDVVIHPAADAEQLQAHSAVLAAASPQIQQLFQSLKEGFYTLRTATIPHHIWNYLLEFVYLGIVTVEEDHIVDLRKIARKLDIKLDSSETEDGPPADVLQSATSPGIDGEIVVDNLHTANSKENSDEGEEKATNRYLLGNNPAKSSKEREITDLVIPSEDASMHSSSSMHSMDMLLAEEECPEANGEQHSIQTFVPSISRVIKEASSRRRKSTPRKVIQQDVPTKPPQIAEVQPTPITKPSTPPPLSPPTSSSNNSTEGSAPKKPRPDDSSTPVVSTAPPTSLPLNLLPQLGDGNNFLMASPFFNPQLFGSGQQLIASQLLQNAPIPFYLPTPPAPGPPAGPPPPLPMESNNSWPHIKMPSGFPDKNLDPGSFSISDPPEDYNDFIQWVKAVRAKLRISQTALSDALNNEPRLTKRYSQTIISSFETFKMSQKEVAFLRPFIVRFLQNVAKNISVSNA